MTTKKNDTLILAVGMGAVDIIDQFYSNNSGLNFLCFDEEKVVINTNDTKTIWFNDLELQKTKADVEAYKKVLLNRTSKFNEEIKKYGKIIVCSFLNENYSALTLFEMLEYFNKIKLKHSVFIVNYTDDNEKQSLDKLMKLKYSQGQDLFIYDISDIVRNNSKRKAISLIRKNTVKVLNLLLELI